MPEALWIGIAVGAAGVLFGLGCLIWARRQVGRARGEVQRLRNRLARPPLEKALRGGRRAVKAALSTPARVREEGLGGILSSLEELVGWAEVERPDLRRLAARDGTVTIMFSDIVDSTRINERLGDRAFVRLLAQHDRVVRDRVAAHDGFVVKSQGDGFMVAFSQPEEAVRCAADVQRAIVGGDRRMRKEEPIEVRIGVHTGKAVERDGDLFGRNVAFAARVAGTAQGGQILVSAAVAERLGELDDLPLAPAQDAELKGLPGRHQLFAVEWEVSRPAGSAPAR